MPSAKFERCGGRCVAGARSRPDAGAEGASWARRKRRSAARGPCRGDRADSCAAGWSNSAGDGGHADDLPAVCRCDRGERGNSDEPDDRRLAQVKSMQNFDEAKLISEVGGLPPPLRVAFAAACAERQMPAYRQFEVHCGRSSPNALDQSSTAGALGAA
jgi:hypothetical protein